VRGVADSLSLLDEVGEQEFPLVEQGRCESGHIDLRS
jgi:hypothetical protein